MGAIMGDEVVKQIKELFDAGIIEAVYVIFNMIQNLL